MNSLYKFINDTQIQPYNGEILTKYEGDKIIKVVSNPTEADLKEFGYMKLVTDDDVPEHDPETQSVEVKYTVKDAKICQSYQLLDNQVGDITIV